ncbi:MAG: ATP-binding cassette domain-containing protein [Desulfobacteraceae bacterium]|jgi:tungstate transport system ATP-binding protein
MLFMIKDLTKVYGNRTVLDIPNLAFQEGIIYALQGPNGSGKTTLLEILSLLIPPTTGEITYGARKIVFSSNNMTALRREIVMVQQNPVLFTTTVYKNVEFGLRIRGASKLERQKVIEESLDLVGMGAFAGAEASKLSGGETQRVAIARALACSPKVMFFDEPTANVDVENQIVIEQIIQDINTQKKISVILTTHNLTQASRLSQEVISLFEGRRVPSIFENMFSGRIEIDDAGNKHCLIQDKVRLLTETERRGEVRLSIDPLKIKILSVQELDPKKNVFRGRLVQLTEEQDLVRAVLDIGIPLNILLQKDTLRQKALNIGDEVGIFCPKEAIQIF